MGPRTPSSFLKQRADPAARECSGGGDRRIVCRSDLGSTESRALVEDEGGGGHSQVE